MSRVDTALQALTLGVDVPVGDAAKAFPDEFKGGMTKKALGKIAAAAMAAPAPPPVPAAPAPAGGPQLPPPAPKPAVQPKPAANASATTPEQIAIKQQMEAAWGKR